MKRSIRRLRANYYYVQRPLREFLPSLLLLIALLFVCGWSFYTLYRPAPDEQPLSFVHALHVETARRLSEPSVGRPRAT